MLPDDFHFVFNDGISIGWTFTFGGKLYGDCIPCDPLLSFEAATDLYGERLEKQAARAYRELLEESHET